MNEDRWPELRYERWKDTLATLHRWTQIAGKIRLRLEPPVNHWWNVTFYVTQRGLTTSNMPYRNGHSFAIAFDFLKHRLGIDGCDGESAGFALEPMNVADFYERLMAQLRRRLRRALLSRAAASRPAVQAVPRRLYRQGEPGALLLGQLRSGGNALLGAPSTAASGRHCELAGPRHAGSVFARGTERRFLAGHAGRRPTRTPPCSRSLAVPTLLLRRWPVGIAPRSSESSASLLAFGP